MHIEKNLAEQLLGFLHARAYLIASVGGVYWVSILYWPLYHWPSTTPCVPLSSSLVLYMLIAFYAAIQ